MTSRRALTLVVVVMMTMACSSSATGPRFPPGNFEARVLFVGNSLTYTHDVPGLVRRLAAAQGRSIAVTVVAEPDYSLADHWLDGIEATMCELHADVVVLQQGPSSLEESRELLVQWSVELARVIREAGGEPALYMVWPDASRRFAFPAVERSYAMAADSVKGTLLPVGTTWLEAWQRDSTLVLYAADGLHASYLGALAAAHTIYAGLFDIDPATLPALDDAVSPSQHALLRDAVAASLAKWLVP